jgi:hypothetical protein
MSGPYWLDRREVDRITAYLFHAGGHEDPEKLKENEGKSFQGSIVLGMGFTFDGRHERCRNANRRDAQADSQGPA